MYFSTIYGSPVGLLTLASDGESLIGLWIEGQKYHGNSLIETILGKDDLPIFNTVKDWLDKYFAGEKLNISQLPLAPNGSDFRKAVWEILCEIPYGEVITYGHVAKKIAKVMNMGSMSSQAVGGAIGHNPISIIIPCHRVVGSNGSLTGYAGGIEVKKKLLQLEGVDMTSLFTPQKGTAL